MIKNFLVSCAVFCAVLATSVGVSMFFVHFAHADALTFLPAGPEASMFLQSSVTYAEFTDTPVYAQVIFPDLSECNNPAGGIGPTDNFRLGLSGPFGSTNWDSYGCTGIDWTADGNYVLNLWAESGHTTLLQTATFCQGDLCEVPPPPTPADTSATSSPDQVQQNAWNAFFAFLAILWMMLWLGRNTK